MLFRSFVQWPRPVRMMKKTNSRKSRWTVPLNMQKCPKFFLNKKNYFLLPVNLIVLTNDYYSLFESTQIIFIMFAFLKRLFLPTADLSLCLFFFLSLCLCLSISVSLSLCLCQTTAFRPQRVILFAFDFL